MSPSQRLPGLGPSSTYDGEVSILDEIPEGAGKTRFGQTSEIGATGLKRAVGTIDEEFLPALRGRKAIEVFREMSRNDPMVGAMLFAIDKLIREIEWEVKPADQTPDAVACAEFVEECRDDMSHSFDDLLSEILTMLPFGFSWHEIVYKKRIGPWEKNPKNRSKYTDGKIGWRKMPIRSQETLLRWVFDETGGVRAFIQMAPPLYHTVQIPIEKSLLFRPSVNKGNPEGLSILRNAYRPWWMKKRIEEFEAIGVERDLAGMPTLKLPSEYLKAASGTDKWKALQAYRRMVRGVRRDENEGLIIPSDVDPETKMPLFEFELMASGGERQFDTNAVITRYEQRILMTVLADFILVGHEEVGSYALHTDKSGIFRASLNSIAGTIADVLNRYAIPRLFEANGWKPDQLPKFVPSQVDPPDLEELGSFIQTTAGAGMQWFPDPDMEKFLRDAARLPEMSEETMEFKRQQMVQAQSMEYATNQMDMLGVQQKAEMTAAGFSPEQAQLESDTPTPDQAKRMGNTEMAAQKPAAKMQAGMQEKSKQADRDHQMRVERVKASAKKAAPAKKAAKKKPGGKK